MQASFMHELQKERALDLGHALLLMLSILTTLYLQNRAKAQ